MLMRFLCRPGFAALARMLCALATLTAFSAPGASFAGTNIAVDPGGGGITLLPSAPVTVNVIPPGNAVTSVLAEIDPTLVTIGSPGIPFTYDILTTVNAGDTGVNEVSITAPARYTGLGVTGVSVGGVALTPTCPLPAPGQFCAAVTGQVITVTLGAKTGSTDIRVLFTANAPGTPGSADFTATVDDISTPAIPQDATPGNADGDPADGNTITVQVSNVTGTITAAPSVVAADGVSTSTITTVLRTSAGAPVPGKNIALSSDRGVLDTFIQPASPTDANGTAAGTISSTTVGPAIITATDTTDGIVLSQHPTVYFTQGRVLDLVKSASKTEAVVGDVVTYLIEIRNLRTVDAIQVRIEDRIPPDFKYVKGSARLNGAAAPDPVGNRAIVFDIGTVPALVDANGNGRADPGEQGYVSLTYGLVIGSGAAPRDYVNTAVAKDACDQCLVSNSSDARVTVTFDPLFDLGTVIGKVFEDKNGDGWQDRGEPGIAGVMVALDDGTYALTDEHGRYHFPAVRPGYRLVKVNLQNLAIGATATTDEALTVQVTPGLLAKANFGILYRQDTVTIGSPRRFGLRVTGTGRQEPAEVVGSAETLSVLINGRMASFPSAEIRVRTDGLDDIVELVSGSLEKPVEFFISSPAPGSVSGWKITVRNDQGDVVRTFSGSPPLPETVPWDGILDSSRLIAGGEIYQYQLELTYADGTKSESPRRLFGVNRTSVIALSLTGGAFETGSDRLSAEAMSVLKEAAEVMRRFPEEKVVIEGHTDNVGPAAANLALSRKRAETAVAYLVDTEQLPRDRFIVQAYGEKKPIASNALPEGRELNRRVEIKGEMIEVDRAKLIDQYRTSASAKVNGADMPLDKSGRFSTELSPGADRLDLEVTNPQGHSIETRVSLPTVEIIEPVGTKLLTYGDTSDLYTVNTPKNGGWEHADRPVLLHTLLGKTAPENTVKLDGSPLTVQPDGTFSAPLSLKVGRNAFGMTVVSPDGYMQFANLLVSVADRDKQRRLIVTAEPVPALSVKFPPEESLLRSTRLVITGATDPANTLTVNGEHVPVQKDGGFSHTVTLPKGKSVVTVRVTDPEGHDGTIERAVEVPENRMFFLAFADAAIGQMQGKGHLEGAGMDKQRDYYTEGKIAFYIKGTVAGKYLITAAFDTGTGKFNRLFKDLDDAENERLLTNLNPDKLYPVYGDAGTVVYDAQSQGKLYLSLESDEINALIGNYPLNISDVELASYRRTLFGGKLSYRSLSRTKYGQPDTKVVLFGAEARQEHIRDELRATGGSLYYLSHREIIEGSEQVTLAVRDKNTGLPLSRTAQQRNVDYTIRYEEGRILFNRPVASTASDAAIINQALLAGNPVFIEVDYERRADSFDRTASGGRVRHQLGDHVAVGGTYVKDELASGSYELTGGDAEVRLGANSRLVAEVAGSTGSNGDVFVSEDGGLTYQQTTLPGTREGSAWKTAVELDAGEWFGSPDRVRIGGYFRRLGPGFASSGTVSEQGTERSGIDLRLRITERDKFIARFDRERIDGLSAAGIARSDLGTVQYSHDGGWWSAAGEYLGRESADPAGNPVDRMSLAAARLKLSLSEALSLRLDRQETLTGVENDQTTVGIDYRVLESLSLQASATKGTLGDAAQGGATLTLGGNRLYVTERHIRDSSGSGTSTVAGAESPFGPSSKVYTEYQWEKSAAGDRNLSLIGAQKQWDVSSGLSALLSGEIADIESAAGPSSRFAIAAGLSYSRPPSFKASTRDELRREKGAENRVQYLTSNIVELRLLPDITALGKYRYSRTRDTLSGTDEARFEETTVGLAYRPVAHDRFNALSKYTRLSDRRPALPGAAITDTTTDVASLEWSFDVNRRLEWVEKAALKKKAEDIGTGSPVTTHTTLSINRLNISFKPRIAAGIEYRMLTQREADDERKGWLTELMWKATPNFRLGLGYNFTDFSDNEYSDNDYSVYGWFFRMQAKY